jgi:hypothetical protein
LGKAKVRLVLADKGPMAGDGAGGAIDATSVRILYRRWSGEHGEAWRRVPGRRAIANRENQSINRADRAQILLITIPEGDPAQTITKLDRHRPNRHQKR